jgi:type II secretory pathway predicted ATPase ExeA
MYTAFYELKEEPFRLTPDPRFLHLADPHRTALKALLQGVLQRKGFIVVAGPVGTGKTTVLHTALQILTEKSEGRGRLVSAFLVNPTLSPAELLEAVLDEYEISTTSTSKPKRLAALHEMLFQTQQQGGTAVLLIDEAHLMTVELLEEIRLLGNTDTYHEKLLQIVLCGQPELFAVLQRRELQALQQRIANTCLLRPLALPETRAYIAERLHAAGLRGAAPFTGTAVESIHTLSGGVPRLINLLCDACLTAGFEAKKRVVDQSFVERAAEEVLSVLKPPSAPQVVSPVAPSDGGVPVDRKAAFQRPTAPAPGGGMPTEGKVPPSVSSWANDGEQVQGPVEVNANTNGSASVSSPANGKGAMPEQKPPDQPQPVPHDGERSKSTFDVLISALKQNRATVRR